MISSTLKYREVLEAKARELADGLNDREQLAVESPAEEIEKIVLAEQRDLAVRLLGTSTRIQWEVRAAVDRLGGGDFGICEQCGLDIPAKRLDALPWARRCVSCQQKFEANEISGHAEIEEPIDSETVSAPVVEAAMPKGSSAQRQKQLRAKGPWYQNYIPGRSSR